MKWFSGLFWKFAAAILIVLIAGTLLQGVLWFAFLRPLVTRWEADRAQVVADAIAADIRKLPDATDSAIETVLRAQVTPPAIAMFVRPDGDWLATEAPSHPVVRRLLDDGRRHGRDLDEGSERGRGRRDDHPPHLGPPGAPDRSRLPVFRVNIIDGPLAGSHVLLLQPPRVDRSLRTLAVLPLAFLLAGISALGLVRMLVRRIRALETLAARVEGGDLTARTTNAGRDEIGRLGQRMNRMIDRIETNDVARRRLLGDITHELATPLTSIRGFTETLLDPNVETTADERAAYLSDVLAETKRLDALIQELLDLNRLEAADSPLDLEPIDVIALARHTVDRLAPSFRRASLDASWDGPESGGVVNGDGRRLEQVVENLLMNARRYVPTGGHVTVRAESSNNVVSLIVEDDGPGFDDDALPHVFDRFYRGDPNRSTPGSGLGLAIVKEIVRRHGGTVSASNRGSGGASMRVELPAS